jgi:hypothetical protein
MRLRWVALALCVAGTSAWAQEAPKPWLKASIASPQAVDAFLKKLDFPLTVGPQIEQAVGLEAGALAQDRPGGAVVLADDKLMHINGPLSAATIVVVPVQAGGATPEKLKENGWQAVEGKTDEVTRGGLIAKRSGNALMITGGSDEGIARVAENGFAADVASGALAVVSLDLAALKAGCPDAYNAIIQGAKTGGSLPKNPAEQSGRDAAVAMIEALEHLTLQLVPTGDTVHLKTAWSPTTVTPPKGHPRPAFPANTAAEIHVAFPPGHNGQWIDNLLALGNPPRDAAQIQRVFHLLVGGDTVSVAIGDAGDGKSPTVYVVEQFDKDFDAVAELKALWNDSAKTSPSQKPLTTYDLGGKTVTRANMDGDRPDQHIAMDLVQDGHTVMVTFSPAEGHPLEGLAKAGMKGELPAGLVTTGTIDPGQVVTTIQAFSPTAVPPPAIAIGAMLMGNKISWTSEIGANKTVNTDLSLPVDLVKTLMQLGMMAGPGPAPAQ